MLTTLQEPKKRRINAKKVIKIFRKIKFQLLKSMKLILQLAKIVTKLKKIDQTLKKDIYYYYKVKNYYVNKYFYKKPKNQK